jgi:hypothetical protein
MLTISQGLIFKPHRLLSEIALQVADLLGGTLLALAGGGAGVLFFIKQKIIETK